MSRFRTMLSSKWMILPPIGIGMLILIIMVKTSDGPQRQETEEVARSVRVTAVLETTLVPRAYGFGTVQPGKVWRGVVEVGGKIVELNPRLEVGTLLPAGELLLRIDPLEYEIAHNRAQAQVRAVSARLDELDLEETNLEQSLTLEQQNLRLLERDFRRNLALVSQGSIAESLLERAERDVLRQRLQVQSMSNNLKLIPSRREQLRAEMEQSQSQLQDAKRRLDQTELHMPFPGRIAAKAIELGQAVAPGSVAVEVDDIQVAEIEVGLPLSKMNGLIKDVPLDLDHVLTSPDIFKRMGLDAIVRLDALGGEAVWQADFSRIDATLDRSTRTVGVIVAVHDAYRQAKPGKKPPLVKGMLCEVELRGPARSGRLIPREALHGKSVYVVDASQRLRTREVTTGNVQSGFAEITDGLDPGELVIISDVAPAVEGMLLKAIRDEDAESQLASHAAGGEQ